MIKKTTFLIVFALLITVIVSGCTIFKKTDPVDDGGGGAATGDPDSGLAANNLTNIDPTSIDSVIKKNYADAKVKATSWKSDAIIATVSVKLPIDLATNKAEETYIFGSATESNYWFSYSVSEADPSKFIRAIIYKEDYLGTGIKPINTTYWKMNYIKAFQLAEAAGGKNFRALNKNSVITTTLNHSQPKGWLWWEVKYQSTTTTDKLILKVNPGDNNVIDANGNPVTTSEQTTTKTETQ